ncbi:MAG: DUF2254 domain-containing protein [Propionibacteriaceae bacterium]|nr:DUF2254 domain-containing protein [Propionibacteriaceae bacterium]
MEGFLTRLKALPTRIWFIPAILIVLGLILGEGLAALDRSEFPDVLPDWLTNLLFVSGPTGASAMVTTVGTAVFGVAGTAFSITISVIATASSTYGPRLVRNFMADRGNQTVLGMFGATFAYALMVLRHIHASNEAIGVEAFVPQLAVNFTLLLAVVDVALLIYFIHHIATSIEVSTLTGATRRDLARAIDRLYPSNRPELSTRKTAVPLNERFEVRATASGFVAQVYAASLRSAALSSGSPIVLLVRPGDHVLTGTPLATIDRVAANKADELAKQVHAGVDIQRARTPEQDIRFCLSRLIEIGVRAMSPGTNDPYTAVNAVHELTTALCDVLTRPEPWPGVLPDSTANTPILVVPVVSHADLVQQAFDELRPWVATAPSVVAAMTDLGEAVRRCGSDEVAAEIDRQLAALAESIESANLASLDRDRLLVRLEQVRQSPRS